MRPDFDGGGPDRRDRAGALLPVGQARGGRRGWCVSRRTATRSSGWASSSTSKSRSSAGSAGPATASTAIAARTSRGIGWEYVHVAIDDATRLVYVEVLADEKAITAVGFLRRTVAHFAAYGIQVERLMTDNGSAYRATIHALACKALAIKHLRTRPYRPRTNGKAERFIRTMLAGWAYGAIYRNSDERGDLRSPAGSTSTIENEHARRRHGSPLSRSRRTHRTYDTSGRG